MFFKLILGKITFDNLDICRQPCTVGALSGPPVTAAAAAVDGGGVVCYSVTGGGGHAPMLLAAGQTPAGLPLAQHRLQSGPQHL